MALIGTMPKALAFGEVPHFELHFSLSQESHNVLSLELYPHPFALAAMYVEGSMNGANEQMLLRLTKSTRGHKKGYSHMH